MQTRKQQVVLTLTRPQNGRPDRVVLSGEPNQVIAFALSFAPYERMMDYGWPDARATLDMLAPEGQTQ